MKRNLYLDIQNKEEALSGFLKAMSDIHPDTEQISVIKSLGRTTAEAVFARYSSPSYNSCAMDGIGVISSHTREASENHPVELTYGTDYVDVDTGDMILPPYDSVIMAEDLIETENGYKIIAPTHPFAHVRSVGEDVVAKEMVLPSHHTIRAIDISVLLASGIREIQVIRKPVVGIIPTGDEMIEYTGEPEDGKIIETNSWMFENLVTENGGIGHRYPIVRDDPEKIREAVLKALDECDIVLINAGSSAGRDDYTVYVLRELGEVLTHGVAVKPGKPVILSRIKDKPVIGLPGYPVSSYLTFTEFVIPVMNLYLQKNDRHYRMVQAKLSKTLMSSLKYEEYVRVKLGKVDGQLIASPLERGAGASMSLVRADGFLVIPQNREGIMAHERVNVKLLRDMESVEKTLVLIGSHDLILDVINDMMKREHKDVRLSSTHVGSLSGLIALKKKEAHLAPSHLLNEADGSYNEAIVREMFPDEKMAIIKGVRRRQGLIVKKGNPLKIRSVSDIGPDVRYVNRQRGAGTRVLFDYLLKQSGILPEDIEGYEHEETTHMSVAVAVQKGNADTGMGIYSSARALDLDFVDIAFEEYDFVTYASWIELPFVQEFLKVLKSDAFKEKLEALGGYSWEETGNIFYL
ncbi:molybdopterin biosynthesis protein [Frisingicoccus sp.]|uniref:molybdopterin biosynthesis protein n=1 Tax=Frisingicoccus sp. TaxID=1918627 RepID=UPI002A82DEBB|nr:molybdopterin biosynthesis protein [Frisingicoccus sp.]MDY4922205.1 molybdopterin biosynthesis protein [Frisingicoccus sp.]